ncbi:MAG TPA: glycerol-3-phosphate acyltransferase [Candidatus Handelsmanbacteria bacterium]|nr:glycerol-3-phosphate acyltransferase [Candidatus Handelsmanbacteria bacterium]
MNDLVFGIAVVIAAYLVGAIPPAHILARRTGRDISAMGSGNIGALNALRSLGKRAAAVVFVVDVGKASLVMLVVMAIDAPDWSLYVAALATMLGHNFSVYIGFRGGKGAAVMTGVSLVVLPYLTLLSVPALILGYLIFRSAFWGLMMTFITITLTIVTGQPLAQIVLCLTLTILVGSTHLLRAFKMLWPRIKTLDFHRIGQIE